MLSVVPALSLFFSTPALAADIDISHTFSGTPIGSSLTEAPAPSHLSYRPGNAEDFLATLDTAPTSSTLGFIQVRHEDVNSIGAASEISTFSSKIDTPFVWGFTNEWQF